MKLQEPIQTLLTQLQNVINGLTGGQYQQEIDTLSPSTIGQHTRHILEFYIELNQGYLTGIVNYDKRLRNRDIESDKNYAIQTITSIVATLDKPDRNLILQAAYGDSDVSQVSLATNYYRELAYNLEHTVHHIALIRIGIQAISDLQVPEAFGVSAATLKYRQACAR